MAFGARSSRNDNPMSIVNVLATVNDDGIRVPERIGPYSIYGEIGAGGMASVYLGKLDSAAGFSQVVAIKRMHAELARSPEFVEMFLQEARLVGRIQHPNVVSALDCVATENNAMLIMEYVHGVSLSQLTRKPVGIPLPAASAIVLGAALGLHAAHEAVDADGKSLEIVHRDVSPQNILVGVDGLARVLDFGVAKAAARSGHTRAGEIKGKLSYMAPEQLLGDDVGREADIYSLGVVLWELVTGRRLFRNEGTGHMMTRIAHSQIESPRTVNPSVSAEIAAVVMKAVAGSPKARYRTALEFAAAIERTIPVMAQRTLGAWIADVAKDELAQRAAIVSHAESSPQIGSGIAPREVVTVPRLRPHSGMAARVLGAWRNPGTAVSLIALIKRRSWSRLRIASAAACAAGIAIVTVAAWPRHSPVAADVPRREASPAFLALPGPIPSAVPEETPPPPPVAPEAVAEPSSTLGARLGSVSQSADSRPATVGSGRDVTRTTTRWHPGKLKTTGATPDPDLGVIGGRE